MSASATVAENGRLEAHHLQKSYGSRKVVHDVSISVQRGEVVGLLGPNGAGKTTTIRMLLGLVKPSAGSAKILAHSISEPETYLPFVGAMIEGPSFYPLLSGAANLKVLADLGGIPTSRVKELLRLVGLEDRANSKFKTYH